MTSNRQSSLRDDTLQQHRALSRPQAEEHGSVFHWHWGNMGAYYGWKYWHLNLQHTDILDYDDVETRSIHKRFKKNQGAVLFLLLLCSWHFAFWKRGRKVNNKKRNPTVNMEQGRVTVLLSTDNKIWGCRGWLWTEKHQRQRLNINKWKNLQTVQKVLF